MLCAAENRPVYRRARNGPQAKAGRDSSLRHAVARGLVSEGTPASLYAVAALAEPYADVDWTSAAAASAARDHLADLLDARQLAAAAPGRDALFAAWQALASMALQDLTLWARQLPQLIGYARPRPPAALSLASVVSGRDADRRTDRVERCAAFVAHADQLQGSSSKSQSDTIPVFWSVSDQGNLCGWGRLCYLQSMLKLAKVNEVVSKAASAAISSGAGIQRVDSEPTLDSQGKEALDITIVLKRGSAGKISGDSALDTLVTVEKALRKAKEERVPIISFVTEGELDDSSGDTEP
jgi:hypothetical protein